MFGSSFEVASKSIGLGLISCLKRRLEWYEADNSRRDPTRVKHEDLWRLIINLDSQQFPLAETPRFTRFAEREKQKAARAIRKGRHWWLPLIVRWTTPINTAPFNGNSLQVSATMLARGFDLSPVRRKVRYDCRWIRCAIVDSSSDNFIAWNALLSDIEAAFEKILFFFRRTAREVTQKRSWNWI